MKVMTLAPIYGGGISLVEDIIEALDDLGVEVLRINEESWTAAYQEAARTRNPLPFYATVHQAIERVASESKPDLCLTFALAPIPPGFRETLDRFKIRSAHWFFEDGRRFPIFERMASEHDMLCSIQPWVAAMLREQGHTDAHYLPLGVPIRCQNAPAKPASSPTYRVSFVGTPSPRRLKIFKEILDLDFNVWGPGWADADPAFEAAQREQGRWLSRDEEIEVYLNSEIVVNLHQDAGRHGDPDFINPRTFVLAALGVPQILEDRLELAPLFDLTQELTVFKPDESVRRRLLDALESPQQRLRKAQKSQARALEYHLLQHRLTQLFELAKGS